MPRIAVVRAPQLREESIGVRSDRGTSRLLGRLLGGLLGGCHARILHRTDPYVDSRIASDLYDLIRSQVPPGFWLRKEEPLTLRDSEPEPDLSLVRGSRADFAVHHPVTAALVVEIAVTSAAEDRSLATLYAEAGVEEYWIVLPVERRVEVHRRPQDGNYLDRAVAEGDAVLTCGSLPAIRVHLAELFN